MKNKRIVHVVDYLMPEMGYQEFLLPKWNAASGNDVFIVTGDRYYPIQNYEETWGKNLGNRICGIGDFKHQGVNISRLPVAFEIKARPYIKGLSKKIKELDPDLLMIHGSGSFSIYQCAFALGKESFPIFVDNHMITDIVQRGIFQSLYYFFHKLFMKIYLSRKIKLFFGVTSDSCEYLIQYEGVPKEKVDLLSLGVDTNIFKPISELKKKEKDIPLIIQSGKLNNEKKPQWLSKAVILLLKKGYKMKLKFIGSGSEKIISEIKNKFKKEGFESFLEIVNLLPLEKLAEEFNKADMVIFPEGTSLSCMEAASCDTAVIMADLPASIERENEGIGMTYKRGDIKDLSEKILSLLTDEKKLTSLSTLSGQKARSLYSYKKISEQLVSYVEIS
jgi:glycosyltransferase involved in cell wall biosynthesis